MNKGKLILWAVIIGLFGVFVFQNQSYFLAKHALGINLILFKYQIPEIYNIVYSLSFFLLGLLIAYFFALYTKYKDNQVIKGLKADLSSRANIIARLESENESLKSTLTGTAKPSDENSGGRVEDALPLTDDEEAAIPEK